MQAILTGSRVYGHVKRNSDIDMVILCTREEQIKLAEAAEVSPELYGNTSSLSIRFGKLNLIATTNETLFNTWVKGTNLLIKDAPVERQTAVDMFTRLREAIGCHW